MSLDMGNAHLLQQLFCSRFHFCGRLAFVEITRNGDIFEQCKIADQMHLLKDKAEIRVTQFGKSFFRHGHQIVPVIDHLSGSCPVHTAESIEQGGFSRTGCAHNHGEITLIKLEIHVRKNVDLTAVVGKTFAKSLCR